VRSLFEARLCKRPQLFIGVHNADACDKRLCLKLAADPNGTRLASDTIIADVDIVVASCKICAGINAQSDISAAHRVGRERLKAMALGLP
jgi:hypothetical protein